MSAGDEEEWVTLPSGRRISPEQQVEREARRAYREEHRTDPDYWVRKAEAAIDYPALLGGGTRRVQDYLTLARYYRDGQGSEPQPLEARPSTVEVPEGMTAYLVPDGPKMLRETLCVAQTCVALSGRPRDEGHLDRLQRLIDECDRHRPLGPDGTHGDRHTPTCGCEDK